MSTQYCCRFSLPVVIVQVCVCNHLVNFMNLIIEVMNFLVNNATAGQYSSNSGST